MFPSKDTSHLPPASATARQATLRTKNAKLVENSASSDQPRVDLRSRFEDQGPQMLTNSLNFTVPNGMEHESPLFEVDHTVRNVIVYCRLFSRLITTGMCIATCQGAETRNFCK
jgi:hypothetical protein